MGYIQQLSLILDASSVRQMQADMKTAGAKGVDALKQEFARKMADLRADFASGLIDEKAFRERARLTATAFNEEVIKKMDELRASGQGASKEYANLGKQIKLTGETSSRAAGAMSAVWGRFKTFIGGIGASIVAAFGVRAIMDFAKSSVAAAAEAESAWSELGVSLKNAGTELGNVRDEIAGVAGEIQKTTRFGDEEVLQGLNTLVQLTGNYRRSLDALGPIADFAAAKHLTFEQAAEIVGKAMEGNDKQLRQYIPDLQKGGDAVAALGRFHGAAAADMDTFAGAQKHLGNMWSELKEEIGKALITSVEGGHVMQTLSTVVQEMTRWVIANREEIARWGSALLRFAVNEVKGVVAGIAGLGRTIATMAATAKRGWHELLINGATAMQQLLGLFLKLENVALKVAERLGMEGVAANIRKEMAEVNESISSLGTFIFDQSRKMRGNLGGDDPGATRTESIGGAIATNVEAGTQGASGSFDRLAGKSAATVKEIKEEWRQATAEFISNFDEQVAAADAAGQKIAEDTTSYLETQRKAQRAANTARIQDYLDSSNEFAKISDADLRLELARQQERAKNMDLTEAQRRAAFDRTHVIFAELEERKRQQSKASATAMAADANKAAAETKSTWIDALGLMVNSFQNLGSMVGGVFDGMMNSLGQVVSGIGAIGGAISALKSPVGGLEGIIGKIAGLAGGLGGIIGAISGAIDLAGQLGGAIGGIFKGSKDPGRLSTNRAAREAGARDPLQIFTRAGGGMNAIEYLLLKSPKARGGGGGWATGEAQEDAWLQLQALLRDLNAVGRLPAQYRHLLGAAHAHQGGMIGRDEQPYPRPALGAMVQAPRFHTGGMVGWASPLKPNERAIIGEVGELVLPSSMTRQLASLITGSQMPAGSSSTVTDDHRSMHIEVNLYGVQDREVPDRVVEAIERKLGHRYQDHAARQGNSRIGR